MFLCLTFWTQEQQILFQENMQNFTTKEQYTVNHAWRHIPLAWLHNSSVQGGIELAVGLIYGYRYSLGSVPDLIVLDHNTRINDDKCKDLQSKQQNI